MSDEWEEETGFDEAEEDDEGCDYGCSEFCEEPKTRENGLCTTECQTYLLSVEEQADGGTKNWKCTACGCTDKNPCGSIPPGQTCHWVRKNLCSSCAEKQKQQVQENMDKSIAKHVGFCQGADL